MPVISGFGAPRRKLPWERINDKIERRVLAVQAWNDRVVENQGGRACRCASASARADRLVCSRARWISAIGNERRSMVAGDVAVIPGDTEHEGFFPEDTEVVDILRAAA